LSSSPFLDALARDYPLELSADTMRSMVAQSLARAIDHIETLPTQDAAVEGGGEALARRLAESLPEHGTPFRDLLDLFFDEATPTSFNTASPGYLAYIPGGGLFHSAVADFLSDVANRYVGVWVAAPGWVQLEVNVIRWFCDIVGYGSRAGGVLTTGGSLANLMAIITARRERLPDDFVNATLYTSDQTHHSVQKAAVLAGFPAANVRSVRTDSKYRVVVDEVQRNISDDRRAGKIPFCIVGNAGTTNTGAVDDLDGLADLAERDGLWLHCDAAYGGFFAMTERGRLVLKGLSRVDSMSLDPHKGLFLPYGTGGLLVRDVGTLRRAHTQFADYMPNMQSETDFVDFCQLSPELSRDFRGLRVWLPLKMHGAAVFREALNEKLDLAQWATDRLRELEGIEILAEPQLSVVAFRLNPAGVASDRLNDLNREFLRRINERKRVYLTATMLGDVYALRICVLSFRTHRDRMESCLEDVAAAAVEVTSRD